MAVVQGRTRAQLRQSIGFNLGDIKTGTATGGTNNTLIDVNTFRGGDDNYNGKIVIVTDASDGTTQTTQYVNDYTSSNNTIQFQQNASFTVASGDTYEIWDSIYNPDTINEFINQSILDATGAVYDPIENTSLHSDGKSLRFAVPDNIAMIQNIYYRNSVDFTRLHACNTAFDEQSTVVVTTLNGAITSTSATSVPVTSASELRANQQIMVGSEKMTISSISSNTLTVSRPAGGTTAATHSDGASVLSFPIVDTKDKKQGTSSNKLIFSTSAGAGQLVSDSITSKDISGYDYLEGWVKITRSGEAATSAGNLKILLDDTANCGSPLETLNVPALTDDTWTFFRVKLANPELDTAIISVGLEYDADLGAATVWLDDLSVVKNDTAEWMAIPRNLWKIDKEAKDIVFNNYVHGTARYNLLKIVGGDKPTLLTSETATSEIDEQYIIARATALAFASASGGPTTDPDNKNNMAGFWMGLSQSAKTAFTLLTNIRLVE